MSAGIVALVDDDADLAAATGQLLTLAGYSVARFGNGKAALDAIDLDYPGVVITDVRMPGMSGIELFRHLRERDAQLPVILITGHGDIEMAVDALKAGAWDFLTKPFDPDILLSAVARAVATRRLTLENRELRTGVDTSPADRLIGRNGAIQRLRTMIPMLGETDLDIVVEGATGTGKALLAKLIHRSGKRARHRFVTLDCAAPPVASIEDLFTAHGLIAGADRGTLLLDNLDRAQAPLQHRLVQLVERRAVALEARDPQPVDLRIIASLDEGRRDDVLPALYHRVAAVSLRLPPLSERLEDLPLLTAHFLQALAETHGRPVPPLAQAVSLLSRADWPGNVRELEMAVERQVLGLGEQIAQTPSEMPLPGRVRDFERGAIVEALVNARGEIGPALGALGIPRETFYYRVKRLGIDLAAVRAGLG